jgi:hypothetical protein
MRHILLFILLSLSLSSFALLTPVIDSIPMSDGRKLAADIYIPSGMLSGPVILIQTPYNRALYRAGLPLGVGLNLSSSNYIFVIVDWRGFYGSSGAATLHPPAQGLDGYYCVEWIAVQTWSNGKVGTSGASALGKIQFQTAKYNPPHLTCICPTVAAPQFSYYEYYPNGDLRTEYLDKLDQLGFGLKTTVMSNQLFNNAWQYVQNLNFYPDSIFVPCFMIGGWYDHNIKDMLELFPALVTQSPANVQSKHRLLMGPWAHGGHSIAHVGTANQGQLTYNNAANWNDSLALLFYDYYLRNQTNGWDQSPVVQYYQMGENTWQSSSAWPPAGPVNTNFYMHADGKLDNLTPTGTSDSVNYSYDPTDPSPSYGGPTLRSDLAQGPYDQSDTVESRHDIAIFTSDALTQNVVLRGNTVVHLKVSSDRFDTDFDVRVTDVYPDGRSMILNHAPFRMRCRNGVSASDTAPLNPGQVYDATLTLPYTCNTFLAGHRMRVDVTSSNYPAFNRNMNNDAAPYPNNSLDTLVNPLVASNTVYTNSINASYVAFPLVGYTAPNGIITTSALNGISVYPNPASDQLHIVFDQVAEGDIQIYDITGSMILSQRIQGINNTVSTDALAPGIYILKVASQQGTATKKISIQR